MSSKSDRGTRRPKTPPPDQPTPRCPVGEPEVKDCGCVDHPMNDDTRDIQPCIAHAIVQAANSMIEMSKATQRAAQALGFAGMELVRQDESIRAAAANEQANKEVDKGLEDGSII